MKQAFKLAWQYIVYHKFKSLILVACVFLTALLPIAMQILLSQFNKQIVSRADSTPAIIGARGSSLDLTLNAIHFKTSANISTPTIEYAEVAKLRERGADQAIPIHAIFSAQGYSVVGTTLEYFDFRNLSLARGTKFAVLGECVVGCQLADSLGVEVGDYIISDRDNALDLAGQSPLRLRMVGILNESRSPDDHAVFVDVKTAWVIQGLGHGHQDLSGEDEQGGKVLSRSDEKIVASPAVESYIEITPQNIESFHFHGDTDDFPITSIIAITGSEKSETILEGKYSDDPALQFTKPADDVRELMSLVFRVKRFFDANAILIGISTAMLLMLVLMLSLRLRAREMQTMFKLGCGRGKILQLQLAEILIIVVVAGALLALTIWGLTTMSGQWVESILVNRQ